MLKHSRYLIAQLEKRKSHRSLHFPKVKIKKWLFSGNEEAETFPPPNREYFRGSNIEELVHSIPNPVSVKPSNGAKSTKLCLLLKWNERRKKLGELLDWMIESEPTLYALKFTLGVVLVSWPAFVLSWTQWYTLQRGGMIY